VPDLPMSRRSFLVAAGGLVTLAACGGGSATRARRSAPQAKGLSAGLLATDLYASPQPQRFAFALRKGAEFASGPPARIAFQPPNGTLSTFQDTVLHANGLPENRGVYTAPVVLATAGTWGAAVEVNGKAAPIAFMVAATTDVPIPGTPAPRAASPTHADTLGVDPICTRVPECPLHTVSLDTVIGAGKPVAVMFATPARCQSRYCGPVLDDLLTITGAYADRITFVHVEIYKSDTGTELVPTVDAWHLASEPWLFGVNAQGTVVSRLDGAFGSDEMKTLLDALAV
jgi:hypothetical protein